MITHNRLSVLKESNKAVLPQFKPKLIKQDSLQFHKNSKHECKMDDKNEKDKENNNSNNVHRSPALKKSPSEACIKYPEKQLSDIELQNVGSLKEFGQDILSYLIDYEKRFSTDTCLAKHEITPNLRAKMIDWMIEVLTNFKCRELTFYLAVKIMDRFFKVATPKQITDLHIVGVTSMFMASKYEDIYPLRMHMVYEKIAHKKVSIEAVKSMEKEIMMALGFTLGIPTSYEFIRIYLKYIKAHEFSEFIEQMSFYLAKVCIHDYEFCKYKVSLSAAACIYVAFKICEQLNKVVIIDRELVEKLCELSGSSEATMMECSQKVLNDAQNFEKQFPGLENLKKTHFVNLANFLNK